MSTSKNEPSRSSDAEFFNALRIVCAGVSTWLDQHPEVRNAARTIIDSVLTDRVVAGPGAKSSVSESPRCDSKVALVTDDAAPSHDSEKLRAEPTANALTSLGPDLADHYSRIEQTIDELSSMIETEVAGPPISHETMFEAPRVDDEFEAARVSKPRYSEVSDADLPTMIDRCRLKAEGTRWATERDERIRDGADFKLGVKPQDLAIIERAKQVPNCYLWMNQPRSDIRTHSCEFQCIANCFDALAEALVTLNIALATDDTEHFLESVQLVAEAQSALRCAVAKVEDHPDTDQQLAYHWLRNRASKDRFYISRFMKITDPADPHNCLHVQQLSIELRSNATVANLVRQRGSSLDKARFHLRKIASSLDCDNEYDWLKVGDAVDLWVKEGGSIRSRELRDILLPLVDDIPDVGFPANFERVIDVLISTSMPNNVPRINVPIIQQPGIETEVSDSNEIAADRSMEVKQASAWLGAKRMVLFAGECDADLADQIIRSFRLKSLDWIPPEDHHADIAENTAAADLIAVLVTNQWETLLWDEVADLASRRGVPCVRLPANCNPHQIAVQIIKQCPDNLSGGDFQSSVA